MSGKIVREVLEHAPEDLTNLELLVMVSLAESAFDNDRVVRSHSSGDAIARRVRSSPGSVRNALLALKERGLIIPLIDRPRKGTAQQWHLPPIKPEHRDATVRASSPRDAKARAARLARDRIAAPGGDANDTPEASFPGDAIDVWDASPRGDAKTLANPVDNPPSGESLGAPDTTKKVHHQVTPPVQATPVNTFPATQVPAEVGER